MTPEPYAICCYTMPVRLTLNRRVREFVCFIHYDGLTEFFASIYVVSR